MTSLLLLLRRDVKTSNILLTRNGEAKVADVGLATMTDGFSSAHATTGTFTYAAPEILMGQPSTAKVLVATGRSPHISVSEKACNGSLGPSHHELAHGGSCVVCCVGPLAQVSPLPLHMLRRYDEQPAPDPLQDSPQ